MGYAKNHLSDLSVKHRDALYKHFLSFPPKARNKDLSGFLAIEFPELPPKEEKFLQQYCRDRRKKLEQGAMLMSDVKSVTDFLKANPVYIQSLLDMIDSKGGLSTQVTHKQFKQMAKITERLVGVDVPDYFFDTHCISWVFAQHNIKFTSEKWKSLVQHGALAMDDLSKTLLLTNEFPTDRIYNFDQCYIPIVELKDGNVQVTSSFGNNTKMHVGFCIRADGDKSEYPVIIDDGYQKPPCISNKDNPGFSYTEPDNDRPYHYYSTKSGSMITNSFLHWLKAFDTRVGDKDVLLLLDQGRAHRDVKRMKDKGDISFTHVVLHLIPSYTTTFF